MPAVVSEILKIKVDPTFNVNSPVFKAMRGNAIEAGVKEQYYGMCTEEAHTLLWVINWPVNGEAEQAYGSHEFRKSVNSLDLNLKPSSWYMPFENADLIRPALTAPVCQLCSIRLASASDNTLMAGALHKTFTDCYYAPGFVGGYWATATNDSQKHYYYLGWETRELHDKYAKTELFDEEMNKLIPRMDEGATNYAEMIQQLSE